MTTAAEKLATYGLTLGQAHDWLFANLANPALVLQVSATFGLSNAMLGEIAGYPNAAFNAQLVVSFFAGQGIDSHSLDPVMTIDPTVVSVSSATVAEGGTLTHTVTLSGTTFESTSFDLGLGFGAGASLDDLSGYFLSNGVTLSGGKLIVPAGLSSFTANIGADLDGEQEYTETYTLSVGGHSGVGTITDSEGNSGPLVPEQFDALGALVALNTSSTGILSTASLHASIVANVGQTNYDKLFSPFQIEGAGDGTFSVDDLGFSQLGALPATEATVESLFYGSLVTWMKAVDFSEGFEIANYAGAHKAGLDAGDPATVSAFVNILIHAFEDPATTRAFTDADIQTNVVDAATHLATLVGQGADVSLFDALLLVV